MMINCDLGEINVDEELMSYLDACNISCGMHAGDPWLIQQTILAAKKNKLIIGAHPSYPDRTGFGRNAMELSYEVLKANLIYQIAAVKGMVESNGVKLQYVKPHGALYHKIMQDKMIAAALIDAIVELDNNLAIMCMPSSKLEEQVEKNGLNYIKEAFIDRRYNEKGALISRSEEGALIHDENEAYAQFKLLNQKKVCTLQNSILDMDVDSFCIHGDNPNVNKIVRKIKGCRV